MGFEPTTACLGSKNSTTELRPLSIRFLHFRGAAKQSQGEEAQRENVKRTCLHHSLLNSISANFLLPIFI